MTAVDQSVATVVARQLDAINRHAAEALAACYRPDSTVSDPMHAAPLRGHAAIVRDFTETLAAFPDLEVERGWLLAADGRHAVEMTIRGTHRGPLQGAEGEIPATGRRIEFHLACFAQVDTDGMITEERRYYDVAGLVGQLGLDA
jgi:steroid delta-isomerase-like uncharacterized protein